MFYKLVFYSLWTERYAWSILNLLLDQSMIGCGSAQSKTSFRSVLTLHNHCIFLFGKYLHSPLCAYLQNRNLLRNSLKLASS